MKNQKRDACSVFIWHENQQWGRGVRIDISRDRNPSGNEISFIWGAQTADD